MYTQASNSKEDDEKEAHDEEEGDDDDIIFRVVMYGPKNKEEQEETTEEGASKVCKYVGREVDRSTTIWLPISQTRVSIYPDISIYPPSYNRQAVVREQRKRSF